MKITCPHCSQTLELTPDVLAALQGQPHFACPVCEGLMAVPSIHTTAPAETARPRVQAATNRKSKSFFLLSGIGVLVVIVLGSFFFLSTTTGDLRSATKDQPFVNTLGMKFVPVPGTNVLMCIHETRYRDYEAYAAESSGVDPSWKDQSAEGFTPSGNTEDHPVMKVSWDDAQKFCNWLSRKEGNTYRLPTNKEWNVAAGIGRNETWEAGTLPPSVAAHHTTYPWGNDYPPPPGSGNYSDASRKAKTSVGRQREFLTNYDDGFPTTAPVMSFKANFLGLYDMGGNVWEWREDPEGMNRNDRILRGASFGDQKKNVLLSSHPVRYSRETRDSYFGFRCVLELPDGAIAQDSKGAFPRIDGLVANGEWQDILDRLDQNRSRVKGEWTRVPDGLELPVAVRDGVIVMETSPLDRFEARVRFTSPGHHRIRVYLPSPSSHFDFYFSPFRRTLGVGRSAELTQPLKQRTGDSVPHELFISVTPSSLSVKLDGELVYERSPMDWEALWKKSKYELGAYLHAGTGIFHSFEIRIPSADNP